MIRGTTLPLRSGRDHEHGIHEVTGSNPVSSTKSLKNLETHVKDEPRPGDQLGDQLRSERTQGGTARRLKGDLTFCA